MTSHHPSSLQLSLYLFLSFSLFFVSFLFIFISICSCVLSIPSLILSLSPFFPRLVCVFLPFSLYHIFERETASGARNFTHTHPTQQNKRKKESQVRSGYALRNCFISFLPVLICRRFIYPSFSLSLSFYIYIYDMGKGETAACPAPNSQLIDQALVDAASRA